MVMKCIIVIQLLLIVVAGLYVNILERPDDIKDYMDIPSIMAQTCRDWSTWSGNNIVDEIDSGL